MHPATRPGRDRNRRPAGSASPAPGPPRHEIFFRCRRASWGCAVPGTLFRDGPKGPDPESRDSGFASRPGMTMMAYSIINHDRPDLDRPIPGARNPRGNGKGGVEILGIDQIIATKLLAGLCERTIRHQG